MVATPAGHIVVSKRTLSLDNQGFRVAWHPSGKVFAVLDGDLRLVEFDAQTGKKLRVLQTLVRGALNGGVAYSPDGKYLVGGNGVISVFDAATGKMIREIPGPYANDVHGAQGFDTLAISPDSKNLAVRYLQFEHTNNANISAFEIETAQNLFSVSEASNKKTASTFSGNLVYMPDGKSILSSRYEMPTRPERERTGEKFHYSTYLDFLDAHSGRRVSSIAPVHIMNVTALATSRDGRYIATGTSTLDKEGSRNPATGEWDHIDNQDPIRLWDRQTGKLVREFGPLRGAVRALSFNPDGSILASCQTDLTNKETIWLWNATTGQLLERVRTSGTAHEFFDCAFSPDGHYLAMPTYGAVELIELRK
jgi:WD40 repeat protein